VSFGWVSCIMVLRVSIASSTLIPFAALIAAISGTEALTSSVSPVSPPDPLTSQSKLTLAAFAKATMLDSLGSDVPSFLPSRQCWISNACF
jgi:hypothetical protein